MAFLIDYFLAATTTGALLLLAVAAVYKTVRLWRAGSLKASLIAALRSDYERHSGDDEDERYM